jgi:hypothetical protein
LSADGCFDVGYLRLQLISLFDFAVENGIISLEQIPGLDGLLFQISAADSDLCNRVADGF